MTLSSTSADPEGLPEPAGLAAESALSRRLASVTRPGGR
jgi:hypothetical protein